MQVLGLTQILEAMAAEVVQDDAGWQITCQIGRCLRHQHLAAIGGRHDALDAHEREVALVLAIGADSRSARVQAHADAHDCFAPQLGLHRALGIECGSERTGRGVERGAECVADDLKDKAGMRLDGVPQDDVVACLQRGPCRGVLLRQPGAAFDIREEEGDGASWKIGHWPCSVRVAKAPRSLRYGWL